MNIAPTLEGGLRIDAEDLMDWQQLQLIVHDARKRETDLALELGSLVEAAEITEDWKEYVIPDLREAFDDQVSEVANAIETAMLEANGGAGSIWITRANGMAWYGALNQARLAIEECYHFATEDIPPFDELPAATRFALRRTGGYETMQYMLLKFVMR